MACASAEVSSGIPSDQKPIVYTSASKAALTLDELVELYDVIAYGTITEVGECVDVEGVYLTHTTYYAEVKELFKGDASHSKKTSFKGVGGESPTKIVLPDNKKLPQVGDQAFFFVGGNGVVDSSNFWLKDGKVVVESYQLPEEFKNTEAKTKTYSVEEFSAVLREKTAK